MKYTNKEINTMLKTITKDLYEWNKDTVNVCQSEYGSIIVLCDTILANCNSMDQYALTTILRDYARTQIEINKLQFHLYDNPLLHRDLMTY